MIILRLTKGGETFSDLGRGVESVPCERRHRIKACIIGRSGRGRGGSGFGEGFLSDGRSAKLAATEIEWRRTKKGTRPNQPTIRRARAAPFSRGSGSKKRSEGRERFVEPNPLLLFGFGRKKSVGYAVPVRGRECTFSADDDDDGGSWSFGSAALFVADPIWRFWRFPSETVIMASGWIVGQMSGTASLPLLVVSTLRVVCEQRFFSHFCVGWLSIIFGTLHNNATDDLTNAP